MAFELDLESEWDKFCEGGDISYENKFDFSETEKPPECSEIYISTKTKIAFLNQGVDLSETYWSLPIVPYHIPKEGIIKKQMKFNSSCKEELDDILKKVPKDNYVDQHVITQIINPDGRIQFKDVRKMSIGLCKKDIISYRGKKKGAFYNCFVLMLRVFYKGEFKEVHVKVFNTGKLEIPGMQNDDIMEYVLQLLIKCLNENVKSTKNFDYIKEECETVLINSNFRCGYYLNREKLYSILKNKYRINCSYDSCSYPGIQSEFYYDPSIEIQTGQQPQEKKEGIVKVSFMIFRTGSALIVGKCTEEILYKIYDFLCNIFVSEYKNIYCGPIDISEKQIVPKRKINRKKIMVEV